MLNREKRRDEGKRREGGSIPISFLSPSAAAVVIIMGELEIIETSLFFTHSLH